VITNNENKNEDLLCIGAVPPWSFYLKENLEEVNGKKYSYVTAFDFGSTSSMHHVCPPHSIPTTPHS
jgi:hypothetical protein